MTSTSNPDEFLVKDFSRDVIIYLVNLGKQIVVRDSEMDLTETIVNRLPLILLSNEELMEELESIVGAYDGRALTMGRVRDGLGSNIFLNLELEISILIAGPMIEVLRKKQGLVIDMNEDILRYIIRTSNDLGNLGNINIVFREKHAVLSQIGGVHPGNTECRITIEYADPEFNHVGIVEQIMSTFGALVVDFNHEIDMLRDARNRITERIVEVENG